MRPVRACDSAEKVEVGSRRRVDPLSLHLLNWAAHRDKCGGTLHHSRRHIPHFTRTRVNEEGSIRLLCTYMIPLWVQLGVAVWRADARQEIS